MPAARSAQRMAAAALLACALLGLAANAIVWRADRADRRGDFATAVRWRPSVPIYHRHWGEALLLRSPSEAETQLLLAAKLDPLDPLTVADLTAVELALGNTPRALAVNQNRPGLPSFSDHWRLANLFLARGDQPGFWREVQVAARLAPQQDFPAIVGRALTATHWDFPQLAAALPRDSNNAAISYLRAAVEHGDARAAASGADWLTRLPPDPAFAADRQAALADWLAAVWHQWPEQAGTAPALRTEAELMPGLQKSAAPPFLADANFDPAYASRLPLPAADPTSSLREVLAWRWPFAAGLRASTVHTGDLSHPTAAEFRLDGTQPDNADLAQQALIVPAGTSLRLQAWARSLAGVPARGFSLDLRAADGTPIASLPLAAGPAWQSAQVSFTLPAAPAGLRSLRLVVHLHRPLGERAFQGAILVTGMNVTGVGAPGMQ
ncbi:MAG TPA: hypothetical protein VN690_13865 [Terriglobales bacterium]|nr:hypothetical protein [Terriglobales bacterium]